MVTWVIVISFMIAPWLGAAPYERRHPYHEHRHPDRTPSRISRRPSASLPTGFNAIVHRLDTAYYDRHYRDGLITDRIREHEERWH
jgi:hypothetical protein